MSEILKALTGATTLLSSWLLPATWVVAGIWFAVLPAWRSYEWVDHLLSAVGGHTLLIFALLSLGLALIGWHSSDWLYRVIEGYLTPERFRAWATKRELGRKKELESKVEATGGEGDKTLRHLLDENLSRFPTADDDVQPTRLGNAIRALETYGMDRYQFDSQTLWNEALSVVPTATRNGVELGRATVEFFVASVYSLAIIGVAFLLTAWHAYSLRGNWVLWLSLGLVLVAVSRAAYRLAVVRVDGWRYAVQAMVNLARLPLANAMGLNIPVTLDKERDLWLAVSQFVAYSYSTEGALLVDSFRDSHSDSQAS